MPTARPALQFALLLLATASSPAAWAQAAPAAAATAASATEARVVMSSGSVSLDGRPAATGALLRGGTLATGPDGRVQLRLANGGFLALPPGSELQLIADSANTARLVRGGLRLATAGIEWRVQLEGRSVRTNGYLKLQDCAAGCREQPGLYGRISLGDAVLEYQGGRAVLRNRSFRWAAADTRPESLARQPALLDDTDNHAAAVSARQQVAGILKAGIEAFGNGNDAAATKALLEVRAVAPDQPLVAYYLGLIALKREDSAEALRLLQEYQRLDPEGAMAREVPKTLTLLSSAQLQQEVAQAVQREREVTASPPEPGSIAVQAFVNRGAEQFRAMSKGLAAMVIADLSKVPSLKVLEREKVQLLVNEARLGDSGLADTRSAVRSGRLMRAEKVVVGNFEVPAEATRFALEGAVIDSRSSQSLGVINEAGALDALFRAQKSMTFGILRAAGVPLDALPPDVRARVERFQTTNIEAFRAFAQGLDLKDQGRYAEAREAFRRAAELDPNFALAAEQRVAMPDVNLGNQLTARAVIAAAAGTAVDRGRALYAVDAGRAAAALSAGQQVVLASASQLAGGDVGRLQALDFSANSPGGADNFGSTLVAGLAYAYTAQGGQPITLANVNEYRPDRYAASGSTLDFVGAAGDFLARRGGAATSSTGSQLLSDGRTTAYWGSWASTPGASASVTISGQTVSAPVLGAVDYVFAEATRVMPGSGTAVFSPTGGRMANPTGTIGVNFASRQVSINNLGFSIGALAFAGLNGQASYADPTQRGNSLSGAFSGNYSSGSCTGCVAFIPTSSVFSGNFVGQGASGLVFSTVLLTGPDAITGAVQLFTRPPQP